MHYSRSHDCNREQNWQISLFCCLRYCKQETEKSCQYVIWAKNFEEKPSRVREREWQERGVWAALLDKVVGEGLSDGVTLQVGPRWRWERSRKSFLEEVLFGGSPFQAGGLADSASQWRVRLACQRNRSHRRDLCTSRFPPLQVHGLVVRNRWNHLCGNIYVKHQALYQSYSLYIDLSSICRMSKSSWIVIIILRFCPIIFFIEVKFI